MLRKKYRLGSKHRTKFNKSHTSDYFLLRIGRNNLPFCRVRVVVSKKIDKRAVVRNKIRRVFSRCIENLLSEIKEGYDFIFIIKKKILSMEKDNSCKLIKSILKREGFLKDPEMNSG